MNMNVPFFGPTEVETMLPQARSAFQSGVAACPGFHAFRHFNVAMLDALRVPLKTIQERLGHAVTGSFTLDVYGGQPEWERNLKAARLIGAELEMAAIEAEKEATGRS